MLCCFKPAESVEAADGARTTQAVSRTVDESPATTTTAVQPAEHRMGTGTQATVPSRTAAPSADVAAATRSSLSDSVDALPVQGAADKVQLWLSTSSASVQPAGGDTPLSSVAASSKLRSSASAGRASNAAAEGAPMPSPLAAVYEALRGGAQAGAPPAASDADSQSNRSSLSSAAGAVPRETIVHALQAAPRPRVAAPDAPLLAVAPASTTADDERSDDAPLADPPSLGALSASGQVVTDAMRSHVAKVLFDRASAGAESASQGASDDDASLVSMRHTPLRMHQGLHARGREYVGAPKPSNEADRMCYLCNLAVLGTAPERRYNRLNIAAARVFNIPIALVSLVDEQRQWFKSIVGLPGVTETDRQSSFCAWTLLPSSPECLVVSDARSDARFKNNKLVTGPPGIQFYGGCPLVTSAGLRLGSFCVIDLHQRVFTAEDCNLLCNFAELAVRELEQQRAASLRESGSPEAAAADLRSAGAWARGTLLMHIAADRWTVCFANDLAASVLGISDADALIGESFWDVFEPRAGEAADVARSVRCHLLDASDFELRTKVYTEEGRKVWITCSFRSGTQSQIDEDTPIVAVPMDLISEPCTKMAYWFVSLDITDGSVDPPAATPASLCGGGAAAAAFAGLFPPAATTDVAAALYMGRSVRCELYHGVQSASHERCIMHVVATSAPAASAAALDARHREWQELGLAAHALPPPESAVQGANALLVTRKLRWQLTATLRKAAHDGFFKLEPNEQDVHEGVVRFDLPLVVAVAAHLARALAALHGAGRAHGELTDATVLVEAAAGRPATGTARWRFGTDASACFASLGLDVATRGDPVTVDDLMEEHPDRLLFFAPERFAADALLHRAATAEGDVWALGVLLAYMLRHSVPLPNFQPTTLLTRMRAPRGAAVVLELDELRVPDALRDVIEGCLMVAAARRPTATALVDTLEQIGRDSDALPEPRQAEAGLAERAVEREGVQAEAGAGPPTLAPSPAPADDAAAPAVAGERAVAGRAAELSPDGGGVVWEGAE